MRRLNHGDRAGQTHTIATPRDRRNTGLLALATTLGLLICMLTAPALHAETITTRNATLGHLTPAGVGTHSITLSPASAPARVHKDADCSAYFGALFDAMDGLDRAIGDYDSYAELGVFGMIVGEVNIAWAAGNVSIAESKLSGCLGG